MPFTHCTRVITFLTLSVTQEATILINYFIKARFEYSVDATTDITSRGLSVSSYIFDASGCGISTYNDAKSSPCPVDSPHKAVSTN